MERLFDKIRESATFLINNGIHAPAVGIVLGSGLGTLVQKMSIEKIFPYNEIPHFPLSTVEFHRGQLIYGSIGKTKVLVMQGRFHYYEGYSMQQITFPIRVMKETGIQSLLLSNAAGGMNKNYKKGDLVLLEDHINLHPDNPLRGLNDPVFGNRFVDMSEPYDKALNNLLITAAGELNVVIKKGVYVSVPGPNLETKAEYRYLAGIGADMVGMSTVPEVIVANHIGIRCSAISVITDECDPENLKPVNIADIIKTAGEADEILSNVMIRTIKKMQIS